MVTKGSTPTPGRQLYYKKQRWQSEHGGFSFRLPDSDVNAAKADVIECTSDPTTCNLQNCRKTKFWDLPGIGTPEYPDLETYCKKVKLEKFQAFLIFTANRFTENDLKLAQKVRSIGKKFILVCSHKNG